MSDNGPGVLQIGTNSAHEVVLNLPHDMTGHIVFSPQQARGLADTLLRKAQEAESDHRAELAAARIAQVPPVDRSNVCTTTGAPVEEVRAAQTNHIGQHEGYIVLCPTERAKGLVRPYRDAYKHKTCGTVTTMGRALSETYARDPKFYGTTFCVNCNAHYPVDQFVWTADGEEVGS